MKEVCKKIVISIMTIIILFSGVGISNNYVFAENEDSTAIKSAEDQYFFNTNWGIDGVLDGIVGILTWIPRAITFGVVAGIKGVIMGITTIGTNGTQYAANLDNILFTDSNNTSIPQVKIVSIDFFNLNADVPETVKIIRQQVAIWYYSLRNLSAVILLLILVYVGIRMVISTVAEEEAKYKKMFKDWVVSFVLLFLMHYLMIGIIEINKILVTILANAEEPNSYWGSYMQDIAGEVFKASFVKGHAALIIYTIMIVITILYLFTYIKRMLTVAFLIIISPLITITYSIDKMKDNRSQAFDTWLKEFVYNILIQPFHCIIYIVFIKTALELLNTSQTMSAAILAIVMIVFMHKAEDIIKQVFNFQSSSLGKAVANAALVTTGLSMIQKRGAKNAQKAPKGGYQEIDPSSGGRVLSSGGGRQLQSRNAEQNFNSIDQTGGTSGGVAPTSSQGGANSTSGTGVGNSEGGSFSTGPNAGVVPQNTNGGPTDGQTPNAESMNSNQNGQVSVENADRTLREGSQNNDAIKAEKRKIRLNKFGRAMGKVGKWYGYGTLYAILGAMALATGQPSTLLTAYQAGKSVIGGVNGKINKNTAKKVVERNENKFAAVYEDFARKTGRSAQDINGFTDDVLNGRIKNNEMNENEKLYASYVRKMGKLYGQVGEEGESVTDRMQDTLDRINNGSLNSTENYNIFAYEGQNFEPVENPAMVNPPEEPVQFQNDEGEQLGWADVGVDDTIDDNVPGQLGWDDVTPNDEVPGQLGWGDVTGNQEVSEQASNNSEAPNNQSNAQPQVETSEAPTAMPAGSKNAGEGENKPKRVKVTRKSEKQENMYTQGKNLDNLVGDGNGNSNSNDSRKQFKPKIETKQLKEGTGRGRKGSSNGSSGKRGSKNKKDDK